MKIEERLDLAVADVESEMRSGVSFDNAAALVAREYDIPLQGLMADLTRKYGLRPDLSLAFQIEESEQEAILTYLWKIHQAALIRNVNDPQTSEFRNEIWRQVDAKIGSEFDSNFRMKARTPALRELKDQYDYWLGRKTQLRANPPEKPLFFRRLDDFKEFFDRYSHDHP